MIFFFFYYLFEESDLIPGLGTFFACLLLPLELGILIGVGLNSVSILYHAARPKLSIKINTVRKIKEYKYNCDENNKTCSIDYFRLAAVSII